MSKTVALWILDRQWACDILRFFFRASWEETDRIIAENSRIQIQHETDIIFFNELILYLDEG